MEQQRRVVERNNTELERLRTGERGPEPALRFEFPDLQPEDVTIDGELFATPLRSFLGELTARGVAQALGEFSVDDIDFGRYERELDALNYGIASFTARFLTQGGTLDELDTFLEPQLRERDRLQAILGGRPSQPSDTRTEDIRRLTENAQIVANGLSDTLTTLTRNWRDLDDTLRNTLDTLSEAIIQDFSEGLVRNLIRR